MLFDLILGVVFGLALGLLSAWSLQLCVKRGISSGARGTATFWIVGGYVIRYTVLGICIFALVRYCSLATGIMAMCIMAVTTVTVANINRVRALQKAKGEEERS
jgi:hypothetical protein